MSLRSRRISGLLLLATATGVLLAPRDEPGSGSTATGEALPKAEREKHVVSDAPAVPVPPVAVLTGDGGGMRTFEIALDEAVLRDPTGKDVTLRLDPPATLATLPSRLRELSARGEVLPVCYGPGDPHTPQCRRVITRDITLELPSPDAAPTLPQGVVLKERPAYAPSHAIVSAADPFAALAALEPLRNHPGIVSADIQLASIRALRTMPNDTLVSNQWHLKNTNTTRTHVNVEAAWNYGGSGGVKGTGVRIGVIDDGLQTAHPDLVSNVDTVNDYDWIGNDSDPNPGSGDDHGTACAGNAAARGNNSLGVSGTAPEATLVGMRLISNVAVSDSQEAAAMAYLPGMIQVKTNSWGPNDDGKTMEAPGSLTRAALSNATSTGRGGLGTIFLWAGGNGRDASDNSNYDGYANNINVIAIAASDSEGGQAWYSESGANIAVAAPSSGDVLGITTTDRTGSDGYASGDYANDFGGTSSATPTAAGVVALMLEKNPMLGWRDVKEILMRSAYKFAPADADWVDNGAGIHFNHKYGAGLIDASAAVNMASTWINLAAATSQNVAQSALNVSIPDNDSTGVVRSFNFSGSNLRVEHATVTLNISHGNRGELEVTLTSPSGMVSRLAELHSDTNDYTEWTYSSVRHWGENSSGTWTLKIADRKSGATGTLNSATITLNGTSGTPINPGPAVQITSPANGSVFSPGAAVSVAVAASDLTADGSPGTVASVQLLDNGSPVAADTTSPFGFSINPALGSHSLTAIATDSEGKSTTSGAVTISVINQPPVITAASLTPSPQAFSDEAIVVTGIGASDPEGQSLTYSYAWEKSSDAATWTHAGISTATLPAAPGNAGFLWRCKVAASDGTSTSTAFTTAMVNSLVRPPSSAPNGSPFSYDSGLVLRGTDSPVSRDALINEFSQGASGQAEWVEILTLRQASFRQWKLADTNSGTLNFADSAVWDAIPAGTLIVVYNSAARDTLLPAEDTDVSDKKLVLASNSAWFSGSWPSLGNGGDALVLKNASGTTVAGVSYGTSNAATPNVGSVGSGSAAYYAGGNDAAASTAGAWNVTTSTVARRITRAAGDLFISEYVEGSSNNKVLELYNPSSSTVNLGTEGYKVEVYSNGATGVTGTISPTGTIAPGATYVIKHSGAAGSITAQLTTGLLSHNGDDVLLLKKGTTVVDAFGKLGEQPTSGAWTGTGGVTTKDKTLRRKASITTGDTNSGDAFDPGIEWDQFNTDDFSGLGAHTVNGGGTGPSIAVTVSPAAFPENAGASAATGTVTLSTAPAANVVVALVSSDTTAATVPASVTVLAGQTTATFAVAAIDDSDPDGSQTTSISGSAAGYTAGGFSVTVTDNEASLNGVTPGAGNTPANTAFVADLRSGALNAPALFRFGATSQTPAGLTIDPATGLVVGTPSDAPGGYLVVIERYNTLGEVVSQSFTLMLTGGGGYATWIAGYPGLSSSATNGDPDFDGMPNLLEYYLGAHPGAADAAAHLPVFAKSGTTLALTWWHMKSAADVAGAVEWSDSLGSWSSTGVTIQVIGDEPNREQIRASLNVGPGEAKKFLHLKVE